MRPGRPLTLVAVVLAHGAVLVLWPQRPALRFMVAHEQAPLLLWFLPKSRPIAQEPAGAAASSGSAQRRPTRAAAVRRALPSPAESERTAAEPAAPVSAGAPAAIDWYAEAEQAAAHTLERREREARRTRALDHPPGMDTGHEHAASQFGWSRAHTHRWEVVQGIPVLFHINDRCAVILVPLPMPLCKIGKLSSRADLFGSMQDARAAEPSPLP